MAANASSCTSRGLQLVAIALAMKTLLVNPALNIHRRHFNIGLGPDTESIKECASKKGGLRVANRMWLEKRGKSDLVPPRCSCPEALCS